MIIKPILTKEFILNRVSEEDIFRYYILSFKDFNRAFCSELREDKKPSCSISYRNNKSFYKDFSTGDSYDCFSYVMAKYNCNFIECIKIIANDFNISKINIDRPPEVIFGIHKPVYVEKQVKIEIKSRPFNKQDYEYWNSFGCNNQWLHQGIIKPITHYWINGNRFHIQNVGYSYKANPYTFKIYQPFNDDFKWCGNVKNYCFGYNELPQTGDMLFITSSYKDVGCLTSLGYNAIETGSESTGISQLTLDFLRERFKQVIIYFNNDLAGIELAKKRSLEWDMQYIHNPLDIVEKDPSDYFKVHGGDKLNQLIKELL